MTQQELVGRRLGQSSGKVRGATEVVTLVQQLSSMLAVRLQRLSTNFLNEAGSVLQTIMDAASKQFAVELLLPWVQRIALLEPAKAKRVPSHVEGLGFRVATCDACLTEVFAYTLEVSGDGLPPLLAKFWRHLANAVPAKVVGQTPHNVMVLAHWIKGQERERPSERDKRICSALLWFVKGLALAAEVEATGASAAAAKKRWQSAGGVARKASTCTCTCTSAACLCHAVCHIPCAVPLLPLPCAIALRHCLVPMPCAIALCQAKLIAGLRANSQKSRANKLLRNADGAGFSAVAAAAAMGQTGAPDGVSALIGALRSMTAADKQRSSETPAAATAASTTAPAVSDEVATLAQSSAVAELAAPAAVAGLTARTARTAPVAPGDSPKGDGLQETGAPRKKVPSLIVPALKLTKGQASRRAMRPGRED